MITQEGSKTENPVIIDGKIHDPKRDIKDIYKRGKAKGLPRFEIVIQVMQLKKVVSAFPSNYKTFPVNIVISIGQSEYSGKLNLPKSRADDLYSNKVVREQWLEPWISPRLKDKNDQDVKLAYALKIGGFENERKVNLVFLRTTISVLNS